MKRALLCLITLGCTAPAVEAPAPEVKAPAIAVAPHIVRFLALMHFRLFGHATYPDHEYVFCLRIRATPDTAFVDGVDVTGIRMATDSSVAYDSCAAQGYRGTSHNHVPTTQYGEACWHSTTDTEAQDAGGVLVAIVTCGRDRVSLVARTHPRYRELIR